MDKHSGKKKKTIKPKATDPALPNQQLPLTPLVKTPRPTK